jgi:phage RecT family recombinase
MTQNNPKAVMIANFKPDLESIAPYIQRLLPWKGGLERFVQMTELAIRRNFDLLTCNRNSFLLSLIWCAQKNLEPGVDDGCWLIPFKQMVTPVPAYKGLIKVAVETGSVLDVQPYLVYEGDKFEYGLGLAPFLNHQPPKLGLDRGALIGAYVVFTMPDGTKRFAPPMDRPSIEKIREVSPAYRGDPKGSIWVKWEEAMFLKTAIKQGFKYIPVKPALRDLLYDDGQIEAGTKVSLLLHQSDPGLPEFEEEDSTIKLSPPAEKLDTSKFDRAVKKLKWDPETMARLDQWLAATSAAASSNTGKVITADMVKMSCANKCEEFLAKFKEWLDLNFPPAGASPGTGPEAAGPATTASPPVGKDEDTTAKPPDDEGGPPAAEEDKVLTLEERREAVWKQVINKGIPLASLAVLDPPVSAPGHITEQNINEAEELVATYQGAPGGKKK